jgi:hypothetical protein
LSFGNEGIALMLLAEQRRNAATAKTALGQINAAFETMRDGGNAPSAAYYERRLPRARAIGARHQAVPFGSCRDLAAPVAHTALLTTTARVYRNF